ncbi:hypothetical protein [Sedimentibacter sp.]|uniref:hypothetical protein n=1 Tax=Sedimentibacter sp. TaxID=1960295 RepID=UPI0028B25D24|nr:hypothetical protein [Sedimentibacter sp.]
MIKKNAIKNIIIVCTLILLTACSEEKASLTVKVGNEITEIETDSIYNSTDAIAFPAVVRSSGQKPVETEYKGIELIKLLNENRIEIDKFKKATFNASDGYRIILDMAEINEQSNVYLCFERDGENLKSKNQGGNGPFQLIIRRDPFSQRWIKHVNEIILE